MREPRPENSTSHASPATPAAPDLSVRLTTDWTLSTPLIAASGTLGFGDEWGRFAVSVLPGALITPTLTVEARQGSPMPRTAEVTAGLLHATGLPNPGLNAFLNERLPALPDLPCPLVVSIAGATAEEWQTLAENLSTAGRIAALELNLSPLEHEAPQGETRLLQSIETAVRTARKSTTLPLIAKLPPTGADIGLAAQCAADAGADVIAVAGAFPGVAVRLSSRQFRFPGVVGGLSGPCIKPLALYQVWRAAQAVSLPVLGGGGIMTADDALEFLLAGASAVTIGVASLIHPSALSRITADLRTTLTAQNLPSVAALTGAARP